MKPEDDKWKSETAANAKGALWVYPDTALECEPTLATIHPKPPHYHDNLFCGWNRYGCVGSDAEDLELHSELLPGVVSAEDTLEPYESAVGIATQTIIQPKEEVFWRAVTSEELFSRAQQWAELVKNLVEGPLYRAETRTCDARSPFASDSIDLADSEHSVDSDPVPSTPKPRSYASVASPDVFEFSPSRSSSLSASASAFVPTSTPVKGSQLPVPFSLDVTSSPSPPFTNFTFPTLLPTLKKDESGFYTEISPLPFPSPSTTRAAQRTSSSMSLHLPSFFGENSYRSTRGKTSKTREMVEQLRSASASDIDRPSSVAGMSVPARPVSTPLQMNLLGDISTPAKSETCLNGFHAAVEYDDVEGACEDVDGWLKGDMTEANDRGPEAKARRTRNLVNALGRNREDSDATPEEVGASARIAHSNRSFCKSRIPNARDTCEPSVPPAPTPRRKSSRHRSRKSHRSNGGSSVSSPVVPPPMPLPSISIPPLPVAAPSIAPSQPYFAPAYPMYAATPYVFSAAAPGPGLKPMPMHMPMHAPTYFGATYHNLPSYGGVGMYGPFPHPALMQMQPVPVASGGPSGRVAPW